jgi:6-pyruvoyl-tetrahydropterin synthase
MAKTVCKASTHELGPPKLKHLQKLQQLTREPNVNQPELLNLIVLRTKEKSWIVVGKALVTCHHLLVNGNERFLQSSATRPQLFSLEMFTDTTHYEMSNFIKLYSSYLNKRASSYRTMACDFCKLKKGKDSIWNKFDHEKLNKQLPVLQELLNSLMKFNTTNPQFGNPIVNSAFQLLHRDLVRLYATYNDAMIVIISKFYDMKMSHCKIAFKIYKDFLDHLDQFKKFFELAERVGCIVDKGDVPDLSKAPKSLLKPFQEHVQNGVDSNQSTPAKTSGRGSNLASPVQFNGDKNNNTGGNLANQMMEEEARALEQFSRNKQPTPTNPAALEMKFEINKSLELLENSCKKRFLLEMESTFFKNLHLHKTLLVSLFKEGKSGRLHRARYPKSIENNKPYDKKLNPFSEFYQNNTKNTNSIETFTNPFLQQPTPTNPAALSQKKLDLEKLQQQQQNNQNQPEHNINPPKSTNFSDDLLNFGSELSFGQNVMNNINSQTNNNNNPINVVSSQPIQASNNHNSFDPFSMAPTTTVPVSNNNPFNMDGLAQQQTTSQQPAAQVPLSSNPFGNPFAGNMQAGFQQPQQPQITPQVQNDPFADLLGMSNSAAPQQQPFDPFGNTNVLTPSNLNKPTSPQTTEMFKN